MKKLYTLAILLTGLYACEKKEVPDPVLGITLEKTTYEVNEPIRFTFDGTADLVTFYSGEAGKEFRFRERVTTEGTPRMSFTSYRQPAAAATPDTTLRIMVSTNFQGVYNYDNVAAAKWTDITSRATLSKGADNTASGLINLADLSTRDSAIYIAFRYSAAQNTTAAQPNWTIKSLSIENLISAGPPEQKVVVKNMASLTWGGVNVLNWTNTWTTSTTQLQFIGGAVNTEGNQDWIISEAINLRRVPRDLGVSIKTDPKLKLGNYQFAGYTKPGTYTVTFEVMNVNKFDTRTMLKEFVITVQ